MIRYLVKGGKQIYPLVPKAISQYTVSYTHLDVYKRQVTPGGDWVECAEMGWFGMTFNDKDPKEWDEEFWVFIIKGHSKPSHFCALYPISVSYTHLSNRLTLNSSQNASPTNLDTSNSSFLFLIGRLLPIRGIPVCLLTS